MSQHECLASTIPSDDQWCGYDWHIEDVEQSLLSELREGKANCTAFRIISDRVLILAKRASARSCGMEVEMTTLCADGQCR